MHEKRLRKVFPNTLAFAKKKKKQGIPRRVKHAIEDLVLVIYKSLD